MLVGLAFILLLGGCEQTSAPRTTPLTQRGYLWQRSWTPAVECAVAEADKRMDGLVVLGAEIQWNDGVPHVIRTSIQWDALRSMKRPCSLALRVAPFPGPFQENDVPVQVIIATARALLDDAQKNGVTIHEFQLDYDCAGKKLSGYRVWIHALRREVHPPRFVITVLPSWLKEYEFQELIHDVDSYVLQVHSVPTQKESGRTSLCDAVLARKWMTQAERLGVPFSVALPTYRCLAGYDAAGKLRGVMMDSTPLAWPPGTSVLEFGTNADEIATLVNEWQKTAPDTLREVLWYRVPVETDRLNWQWKTLSAVMAGRNPSHQLEISQKGTNPIDLSLCNTGEGEEPLPKAIKITWEKGSLVASDALQGWAVQSDTQSATYTPTPNFHPLLPPARSLSFGWLRFDSLTNLHMEILNDEKRSR